MTQESRVKTYGLEVSNLEIRNCLGFDVSDLLFTTGGSL